MKKIEIFLVKGHPTELTKNKTVKTLDFTLVPFNWMLGLKDRSVGNAHD